jgi:hypothetical protein
MEFRSCYTKEVIHELYRLISYCSSSIPEVGNEAQIFTDRSID